MLYTVVTAGLAITEGPLVVFKAVAGDHVQVLALFAVNVTCVPAHMLADDTVMVGFGFTVNVNVAPLVQDPAEPITDTVAIFCTEVMLGVRIILALFKFGLAE